MNCPILGAHNPPSVRPSPEDGRRAEMGTSTAPPPKGDGPRIVRNARSATTPPRSSSKSPKRSTTPDKRHDVISVDSCKLIEGDTDEVRHEVYGVGRNFNRALGTEAYRTGGEMILKCDLDTLMANLHKNIIAACEDPEHTCRLWVQGSKWWFTKVPAAELCDQILFAADSPEMARDVRRINSWGDAAPACICVCEAREPDANPRPRGRAP